jgi:hypothetical protein
VRALPHALVLGTGDAWIAGHKMTTNQRDLKECCYSFQGGCDCYECQRVCQQEVGCQQQGLRVWEAKGVYCCYRLMCSDCWVAQPNCDPASAHSDACHVIPIKQMLVTWMHMASCNGECKWLLSRGCQTQNLTWLVAPLLLGKWLLPCPSLCELLLLIAAGAPLL